ncbi:tyrosine-type recombinase/integrase [Desulfovibrio ferrophilus]|uniref:Integrase family protein n=1 Tax=Desulfovibrio ferrophilus TaxID=241368 RepID=A0A2Z6AZ01_9BACT|nr:site-specific integrase [Desulfovibrio ferrophilus]BBD08420.1 integrase family protein [Desulfovibrio ferrophilus]
MATRKFLKTRYRGVYYRESPNRRPHRGRADRCFVIWYKGADNKGHWQTIGWASEGITPEYASQKRNDVVNTVRDGKPIPAKGAKRFTVGQAVESYEAWARAEGKFIDKELSRWNKHMRAAFAALPIEAITVAILTEHKAKLARLMSEQSVNHCFSFARRAINHAIGMELYSGSNPMRSRRNSKFSLPQPDNESNRYLTPQEAKSLLANLRNRSKQLHDMSLLSLKTGLRAVEIFSITGADLDTSAGVISFTAKGGRRDSIPAPADMIELLQSYSRAPGEHIFQARNGGRITSGISSAFGRAVADLKLNEGWPRPCDHVIFHTLRHTFASWLAQSRRVTLQELKELMRHEKISMTLRYAKLIPGQERDRQAIIADVLKAADLAAEENTDTATDAAQG